MSDADFQLRTGTVATDFFLNLMAVSLLVALPIMVPFDRLGGFPAPAAPRALEVVRTEREAAETTLVQLAAALAAATDPTAVNDPALAAVAQSLRIELLRRQADNAAQAKLVAQARAAPRTPSFGLPLAHTTDKKAVFFLLAGDLIVPVAESAGRFTSGISGGGRFVIFNPSVPGDPVDGIVDGKGLAATAVGAIDPAKEFVFVFLRDDSFDSFYRLRGLLQQKGIALGWAPLTAANRQIVFSADGHGRQPDIVE